MTAYERFLGHVLPDPEGHDSCGHDLAFPRVR